MRSFGSGNRFHEKVLTRRWLTTIVLLSQVAFTLASYRHFQHSESRVYSLAALAPASDTGTSLVSTQVQLRYESLSCVICLTQNLNGGLTVAAVLPIPTDLGLTARTRESGFLAPPVQPAPLHSRSPPTLS